MLLVTNQINLYGKKITTDLALRSGSATQNDYSRYKGLNSIINQYYKGNTLASLESLFQRQKDFDADSCQPHIDIYSDYSREEEREEYERETQYNPAIDSAKFSRYLRRIEDIRVEYLEDYLANLVFTVFQRSGSGGAIEYDARHYVQPTLYSAEDDSVTELADLQLQCDYNSYSESMKARATENLPYVIKRLHNLSRHCGIHMLSMIAAYVRAKKENALKQQAGSSMVLKKNAVIAKGVYKCEKDGTIGGKIDVSNKNRRASDMFDWLHGLSDNFPSYKEDYLNFVKYCEILNIDLYNDDFTKYDKAFVDTLTVTTLTPNHQYNQAVFDAIRDSGLNKESEDLCLVTIEGFKDLVQSNEILQRVLNNMTRNIASNNFKIATELHYFHSVMLDKVSPPEASKYSWINGFLHYDGELVILNTNLISNKNYIDSRFIISELGFCVHITNSIAMECMTVYIASDNMKNKYINHNSSEVVEWEKFA